MVSFAVYAVFLCVLAAAAFVDLRTLRIPDAFPLALFCLWLLWRLAVHFFKVASPVTFSDGIVSAVMLGGGLLLVTTLYEMFTDKRAMGGGDIKLLAAVGLYLGVEAGLFCLLVACAASLVMSLVLPRIGWKPPRDEAALAASDDVDGDGVPDPAAPVLLKSVPFGPAIAVGAAVSAVLLLTA